MGQKLKFIDLFAGIGGFRIAFERKLKCKCVFSSEWDKYAQHTYRENFNETPFGDIKLIAGPDKNNNFIDRNIPDHDILAAGFPCQPFSLAGVSKKNSLGKKHGFEDPTQGTLFFDIKRILKVKRPAAFFLENVKNLLTHDKKRTFEIIKKTLKEELKYVIKYEVVDGANWVPQHRERIFIVGYDPQQVKITSESIIIPRAPSAKYKRPELKSIIRNHVSDKYTLGPGTWRTLQRHKKYHREAGNGFGYGLIKRPIDIGTRTRTISARYHKDGSEILIEQKSKRPRKLSVNEAMQLQGYVPGEFVFKVSDTQAYKQIGNSVVIPAVYDTAREIVKVLKNNSK